MNKLQRAVKGKVIKELVNDTYYGYTLIRFTDGTFLKFVPYTTGSHNDRWEAINVTYHDEVNDD